MEQLKRTLQQERTTVLKLTRELEAQEKRSALPPEYKELLEECMKVCLLGKSAKPAKLTKVPEIITEMRVVRRAFTASMNLLQRENERLKYENKRIKESSEKERLTNEQLASKVRDIIQIVQKQGESLKEFAIIFKARSKRRE